MKLPDFSSSDRDHARIVLVVVSALCALAGLLVLSVILLTAFKRPVTTELWTLTGSVVTGLLAMLVRTSSGPSGPQPVTVADEPVQVQAVDPADSPDLTPADTPAFAETQPIARRSPPTPYPR